MKTVLFVVDHAFVSLGALRELTVQLQARDFDPLVILVEGAGGPPISIWDMSNLKPLEMEEVRNLCGAAIK